MIHVFVDSLRMVSRFMWKVLKKALNDSKGSLQTWNSFGKCRFVAVELEELWSWYCFEKVLLGVETLQEGQLSQYFGFSLNKKCWLCRKDFEEFSKLICSNDQNQNTWGKFPIARELVCQLVWTFQFCEPWTIADRFASMRIQNRTFWKSQVCDWPRASF